jgi:hypothetical protein
MAQLTRPPAPSSHWYYPDGRPAHRIPCTDGEGDRPTNLRDARKLHLFPSVTTVLSVLAKPGLETWKLNQAILATAKAGRAENESDERWCKRVRETAFEQVAVAANLGTRIHGALELCFNGEPYDEALRVYVEPVFDWQREVGLQIVEREKGLVNFQCGFAGTADLLFRYGKRGRGILDFKTRKTFPNQDVEPYDGQSLQLAAYAATYWGEDAIGKVLSANLFISTTEPGRMEVYKHENVARDWRAFKWIAALWRYFNNYDPRQTTEAK